MTRAQMDLLCEMVSDAVILKLKGFLTEQKLSFATFKELEIGRAHV